LERICKTVGSAYAKYNFNQNKTAFLHVYEKNFGAIKLYEKLGLRRDGKSVLEHHKEGVTVII
jgi:ribosomal protein S18 acetylase RimI-like enzyme